MIWHRRTSPLTRQERIELAADAYTNTVWRWAGIERDDWFYTYPELGDNPLEDILWDDDKDIDDA